MCLSEAGAEEYMTRAMLCTSLRKSRLSDASAGGEPLTTAHVLRAVV